MGAGSGETTAAPRDAVQPLMRRHISFVYAALLVILVGVAALGYRGPNAAKLALLPGAGDGHDFRAYYVAGQHVLESQSLYSRDVTLTSRLSFSEFLDWKDRPESTFYSYPPPLAILVSPLSRLPFQDAFVLWGVISRLSLLAAIALAISIGKNAFGTPGASWRWPALLIVAAIVTSQPLHLSLSVGQTDSLLLLLVAFGLWLSQRGRQTSSGMLLGMAMCIKPWIAPIVAFYLFRGYFRVVLASIFTSAAIVAASFFYVGWNQARSYLMFLSDLSGANQKSFPVNQSLYGLALRAFGGNSYIEPIVNSPALVTLLQLTIVVAVTIVYAVVMLRHKRISDRSPDVALFAWTFTTLFLASPITETIYLVWMMPFLLLVVVQLIENARDPRGIAVALPLQAAIIWLGYPSLQDWAYRGYEQLLQTNAPISSSLLPYTGVYTIGLLAVYAALLWLIWSPRFWQSHRLNNLSTGGLIEASGRGTLAA